MNNGFAVSPSSRPVYNREEKELERKIGREKNKVRGLERDVKGLERKISDLKDDLDYKKTILGSERRTTINLAKAADYKNARIISLDSKYRKPSVSNNSILGLKVDIAILVDLKKDTKPRAQVPDHETGSKVLNESHPLKKQLQEIESQQRSLESKKNALSSRAERLEKKKEIRELEINLESELQARYFEVDKMQNQYMEKLIRRKELESEAHAEESQEVEHLAAAVADISIEEEESKPEKKSFELNELGVYYTLD